MTLLTSCSTQPTTVPLVDSLAQLNTTPQVIPSVASTVNVVMPSPLPTLTSQPVHLSPLLITPTSAVAPPSLIATSSLDNLSQTYTNSQEHYTISLPSDWTVVMSDVGTAYFLSQASLGEHAKGRTNWEASIGGIQFVGRNPKPTENEQYESILPNHCSLIDWQSFEINGSLGCVYTLDCDTAVGLGTQRRQHAYIPKGERFVEIWLNVDVQVSGTSAPLLAAIISISQMQGSS